MKALYGSRKSEVVSSAKFGTHLPITNIPFHNSKHTKTAPAADFLSPRGFMARDVSLGEEGGEGGRGRDSDGEGGEPVASKVIPRSHMKVGVEKGNQIHIIATPQEQKAMSTLYERFDKVSKLVEELQDSMLNLEKETATVRLEIEREFSNIVPLFERNRMEIEMKAEDMKKEKTSLLKAQLSQMTEYLKLMDDGKERYDELIGNPEVEVHRRRIEITRMVDTILNANVGQMALSTQPNLEFAPRF